MSGRTSILGKGLLLIAVPIVFQFALIGVLLYVNNRAADAERWALHTKDVMTQTEQAFRLVIRAHSDVRGMVASGDPNFGINLPHLRARIDREFDDLVRLVRDSPLQVQNVSALRQKAGELLDWAQGQHDLVKGGDQERATARVRDGSGRAILDDLQAQVDSFEQTEAALDRNRLAEVERTRQQAKWVLMSAAAASLVLALGMLWLFSRSIGSRLATVSVNARRMASNAALEPPLAGRDEIAELDHVLHESADRLAAASTALRRQANELSEANRSLLHKTQENETFVYSVSHDLRSPLVNLQGFTKELAHACGDLRQILEAADLPPDTRQRIEQVIREDMGASIDFIQTAVGRSASIIDALLRLSRAGRVEYRLQAVPLNEIVDRIVTAMRVSLDEKKADVAVEPLPVVMGDPTAIEQILANLIGNASNYLDPKRPGRIRVGAESSNGDGRMATVFVRDNGLGIPEAYVSKLFVAFQRLHGNVAKGEGIGLAMVKRMVDRLGGTVRAESAEGVGTTFFVTLPKAAALQDHQSRGANSSQG